MICYLLPSPETYCKGLNCANGVNSHVVSAISEYFIGETDERKRFDMLTFDEVKLIEEIQFYTFSLKIDEFVDLRLKYYGISKRKSKANHVLFFMYVPLMHNWMRPVAIYASR